MHALQTAGYGPRATGCGPRTTGLDPADVRAYCEVLSGRRRGVIKGVAMNKLVRVAVTLLLTGALGVALSAQKPKTTTVQGKVTAVTNESLTISHGADTMTFAVDSATKLVGKGIGTMASEKKAKSEPMTITDGVTADDMVKVTYHDVDGKMHASQVTVVQKNLQGQPKK